MWQEVEGGKLVLKLGGSRTLKYGGRLALKTGGRRKVGPKTGGRREIDTPATLSIACDSMNEMQMRYVFDSGGGLHDRLSHRPAAHSVSVRRNLRSRQVYRPFMYTVYT